MSLSSNKTYNIMIYVYLSIIMEPVLRLPLLDLDCKMPHNISKQFNMLHIYATES